MLLWPLVTKDISGLGMIKVEFKPCSGPEMGVHVRHTKNADP